MGTCSADPYVCRPRPCDHGPDPSRTPELYANTCAPDQTDRALVSEWFYEGCTVHHDREVMVQSMQQAATLGAYAGCCAALGQEVRGRSHERAHRRARHRAVGRPARWSTAGPMSTGRSGRRRHEVTDTARGCPDGGQASETPQDLVPDMLDMVRTLWQLARSAAPRSWSPSHASGSARSQPVSTTRLRCATRPTGPSVRGPSRQSCGSASSSSPSSGRRAPFAPSATRSSSSTGSPSESTSSSVSTRGRRAGSSPSTRSTSWRCRSPHSWRRPASRSSPTTGAPSRGPRRGRRRPRPRASARLAPLAPR
jgi:hypothetical protein